MTKYFYSTVFLLGFISCSRYHMSDGKSRPVYFIADNSVFNDSDYAKPEIYYKDLLNINGNFVNVVELQKGKTSIAIIHRPTLFDIKSDQVIVYPGEHILIKKGKYNDFTFFKINGSKRRNKELSFFKFFHEIVKYPYVQKVDTASLDTILAIEKKLINKIAETKMNTRIVFDSLSKVYNVRRKFKTIAQTYLENESDASLFNFYKDYKETLKAHNVYKEKCKGLIPIFNTIKKRKNLVGTLGTFNELVDEILPYKIQKIETETEFQICFDSLQNIFTTYARDYILSRLMYRAFSKRIKVTDAYVEKYESVCTNENFKKLLQILRYEQYKNDLKSTNNGGNNLLSVDGNKIESLEMILKKHLGKLIVIDFWATWCVPCREEIPHLQKLIQNYQGNKIVFLSVSIEREIQRWKKYVIANNIEISNHYLLLDQKNSTFLKEYGITYIPRYMIIDKEGKVISPETPYPSDLKLKELIDKNLKLSSIAH